MKGFRKQSIHTALNKYIELSKKSYDKVQYDDLIEIRKYVNHLEAQVLSLSKKNENLMEKEEKRYGWF